MHTFAVDAGAPYTLQPLADAFGSEPAGVKLALLTAAAKLFFSRPPEAQKLLGACIAAGLNDGDQGVHDRALLYYRCAWGCALVSPVCMPWDGTHVARQLWTGRRQVEPVPSCLPVYVL